MTKGTSTSFFRCFGSSVFPSGKESQVRWNLEKRSTVTKFVFLFDELKLIDPHKDPGAFMDLLFKAYAEQSDKDPMVLLEAQIQICLKATTLTDLTATQ